MAGRAYFQIRGEMLAKLISLPANCRIIGFREADPFGAVSLAVAIESPDLPDVPDYGVTPLVHLRIQETADGRRVSIEEMTTAAPLPNRLRKSTSWT
jgi:hypothetical protein